jgi:hypothetical protein
MTGESSDRSHTWPRINRRIAAVGYRYDSQRLVLRSFTAANHRQMG